MGFWRSDNDDRARRVNSLGDATTSDHVRLRNLLIKIDGTERDLDRALYEVISMTNFHVDEIFPGTWPPNWIPVSGPIVGPNSRVVGHFTGYILGTLAGERVWRLTAPLTRALNETVRLRALVNVTERVPIRGGFSFTAHEVARAVPFVERMRLRGWNGVVRYASRGLLTAAGSIAVSIAINSLFELIYDEIEYKEFTAAIRIGVKERFAARLALRRVERIGDIFDEALVTTKNLQRLLVDKRIDNVDVRNDIIKPTLANLEKLSFTELAAEVMAELAAEDKEKKAYTQNDPESKTYKQVVIDEIENQYNVARMKKIRIWAGSVIDAIQCVDADGHVYDKWGGTGGSLHEITLHNDEKITALNFVHGTYRGHPAVFQLLIKTNKNPQGYGPYGYATDMSKRPEEIITPRGWDVTSLVGQKEVKGSFDRNGKLQAVQASVVDTIYVIGVPSSMLEAHVAA